MSDTEANRLALARWEDPGARYADSSVVLGRRDGQHASSSRLQLFRLSAFPSHRTERTLAIGGIDSSIRIWDLVSGKWGFPWTVTAARSPHYVTTRTDGSWPRLYRGMVQLWMHQ